MSAVRATRPAAWPALSVSQVLATPIEALAPGLLLFGGFNPADPFVAGQRSYVFPGIEGFRIAHERRSQISGKIMNNAARNVFLLSHLSTE
jgi:hypothetical protein